MAGEKLKGVLIGAGYFAGFQAEAWKRMEGRLVSRPEETTQHPAAAKPPLLVAVADPVPGKARAFADRFGIPRAYERVDQMLEREKPDFADIATRPESHLDLTRAAAERGIHVICQKPMAPTWDECVAMCEACEQVGVRLFIHENWRWQPWYREARRVLASGQLGQPFQIAATWRTGDGRGAAPYVTQPYFREMSRLLVYETLVHLLDTFRFLFGEIASLYCQNRRLNPVIVGEDQSLIQVTFADGRLGIIDANRMTGPVPAPVAMGTLLVECTGGTLRVAPDGTVFATRAGAVEERLPFHAPETGYKGDSVLATQTHFVECLQSGHTSESDGRDYLKTVALVEACYRSNQTGRVVRIGDE
jgi:predicted dehydrogenase